MIKPIKAKVTPSKSVEIKNDDIIEINFGNDEISVSIKDIKKGLFSKELLKNAEYSNCICIDGTDIVENFEDSAISCGCIDVYGFDYDTEKSSAFAFEKMKRDVEIAFILLDKVVVPHSNPGLSYQMCFNQYQYQRFKPFIDKWKNIQLVKSFVNPNTKLMNYIFISKI